VFCPGGCGGAPPAPPPPGRCSASVSRCPGVRQGRLARLVGQHEPWRMRRIPLCFACLIKSGLDYCTYVQYSQAYFPSYPYPRCCTEGARMAPAVATYAPRDPSRTVLYTVIADHLETFLAALDADPDATGLPAYVAREFYDYLRCGILAHGFLRLGCDTCPKELLLPFSCN